MFLAAVASPVMETTRNYGIDVDGSVDIVDKTVSTSQGEFTVTRAGHADASDTVSVSVDAPSNSGYTITIFNSKQWFRRTADATGDASHEFGTGGLRPGTYAVVAGNQSTEEVYAGEPLVIRACAVPTQATESVELSDGLDMTVELDEVESGRSVKAVEAILTDDSENLRVGISAVNDTHYSAFVSANDVDTGDYSLYTVVRGDDRALGESEFISVSGALTVGMVEQSDTSAPDEGSGGADGGGGGGGGTTDDATETATTESDDMSASTTGTAAMTNDDGPSTAESTETTDAIEPTAAMTTDNVVTPDKSATTAQTTASLEVPNTALRVLFDALVVFAVGRRLVD